MSSRNKILNMPALAQGKTLRIAVEMPWDASAHMGTGAYSETMVRALATAAPQAEFYIIAPKNRQGAIELPNVIYHSIDDSSFEGDQVRHVALPILLEELQPDCLFAPATLLPVLKICPMVPTVHDLTFLTKPEQYGPALVEYLRKHIEPTLRAADHIVAISNETKQDLVSLLHIQESRITVIEQPVREVFDNRLQKGELNKVLSQLKLKAPFFFHVSNLGPHKNLLWLIEAFAEFLRRNPASKHQLIVAGGGIAPNQPPDFMAHARFLKVGDRIRYVGRINDLVLKALYQTCDAFLFPSLSEGWGLPVAEANALGTRVIASPFVPSACENQRFPLEVETWVDAISDENAGHGSKTKIGFHEAGRHLLEVLSTVRDSGEGCLPRVVLSQERKMQRTQPVSRTTAERSASESAGISGCTIVRNAVKLAYPFIESIASYAPICQEIILCWDPTSEDDTSGLVTHIARQFPQVKLIESVWNMSNRTGGSELAHQTQIAFGHCKQPWTLYVQADEAIHEGDHQTILHLAKDPTLDGLTFERRSFFQTLDAEILAHRSQGLMRLFRTGLGVSMGDAMHCSLHKENPRVLQTDLRMFNYSRMGTDREFLTRSMNLHRFYHDDTWINSRHMDEEKKIDTTPFTDPHPEPIEATYRPSKERKAPSVIRSELPRIAAHYIAREIDDFGARLFHSSLLSLQGYADQIIIVDNGLCDVALDMLQSLRQTLPLVILNGKSIQAFDQLRNMALANTDPSMEYIHKIDSDEVYFSGGLMALKAELRSIPSDFVETNLMHFMIEPNLVEFSHPVKAISRNSKNLRWSGSVHETLQSGDNKPPHRSSAEFLHFGYCRPQWQTLLKWMQYAFLELKHVDHFKYQFVDGVKRSWFSQARTPDTVLEFKRDRLERYQGKYPDSLRLWLEEFHRSQKPWKEWVLSKANPHLWNRWNELHRQHGCWENTLDEMLRLYTTELDSILRVKQVERSTPALPQQAPSVEQRRSVPIRLQTADNEFRRGFSILMPSWNNLPYLKKCVACIRERSEFPHEIIVHVNEGTDGTLEWIKSEGIKHTLTPKNMGVCVGVNQAATLATKDIVMYMNDDMVVLPRWDSLLVEYAESHRIDRPVWLSSTLIEPTGHNGDFIAPADYGTSLDTFDEARLLKDLDHLRTLKPNLPGTTWAPSLMYKDIFDQIGGFSEVFSPGFGSDPDLAKKVWDIGGRIFVSVGASLVYHFQCKTNVRLQALGLDNSPYETFYKLHQVTIPQWLSFLKANAILELKYQIPQHLPWLPNTP